ncbi:hypothetical protein Glove_372g124 [Diversispora epigaea]|uniref:Uncharacterized protein n=1 Tax=Diversispora epigaea TaxID=1348612 RepID=A0A397HAP1_9GLOM|nr:hypothetical protein Glove_372g124 [Diversispora epigaea]
MKWYELTNTHQLDEGILYRDFTEKGIMIDQPPDLEISQVLTREGRRGGGGEVKDTSTKPDQLNRTANIISHDLSAHHCSYHFRFIRYFNFRNP